MRTTDIWDELMAVERRMDEFARELMSGFRTRSALGSGGLFSPAIEVFRKEDSLVTRIELPGIDPQRDVQVTVEDDQLVVRGEKRTSQEMDETDYYRLETSYGAFERHMPLPDGVKPEQIEADFHDGVLEIRVPAPAKELQSPQTKQIPIKTSKRLAA